MHARKSTIGGHHRLLLAEMEAAQPQGLTSPAAQTDAWMDVATHMIAKATGQVGGIVGKGEGPFVLSKKVLES